MGGKLNERDFAKKWLDIFRKGEGNGNLIDDFQKDCDSFEFLLYIGKDFHLFFPKIPFFESLAILKESLLQIDDFRYLGSGMYSYWNYIINNEKESPFSPNHREFFIFGFSRLLEISGGELENRSNEMILSPEFEKLQQEVERLKVEVCMILLERDELKYVECENIEMAYLLSFGSLEYRAYELHCQVLRVKRKISIIQRLKNRQEKINVMDIEDLLDQEFAEYRKKLEEQMNKLKDAIDRSQWDVLSEEDAKECKKLYRMIVKALHPDLNPNVTPTQLNLLQNAIEAYERGDLHTLRILSLMVEDSREEEFLGNSMEQLLRERDNLLDAMENIQIEIATIKSNYPYTMKALLNDPDQMKERKRALNERILELEEVLEFYLKKCRNIMED
ncbi:MAG: hypothetical protein Q4Q07_07975 [Tissierellia bacterium]|nr:hypothetical protein [Tissierellia bacterium]